MNCNDIKLIESHLAQIDLHIDNKEFNEAIAILNDDINAIADSYISENILDSTGMKLVLANAEEAKGNLETATHLKRNILNTRIDIFRNIHNC